MKIVKNKWKFWKINENVAKEMKILKNKLKFRTEKKRQFWKRITLKRKTLKIKWKILKTNEKFWKINENLAK